MAEKKIKTKAETDETAVKKAEKEKAKAEKKAKKANTAGFLRSVIAERKKITWYSGKQSIHSTVAVIATMVIIAAIIGLVDWLLGQGVTFIGSLGTLLA